MVVVAVQSVVLCERFDEAACDARSGVARLLTELSCATTQVVLVPVYLRAPPPPASISVHLCRNTSVDISRHEVARGHCDRRPRHCCMSHSDELPSETLFQHRSTICLELSPCRSPFRTVTRSRYLNLDLKHICSPSSFLTVLFASASEATATWRFTSFMLYCIVSYRVV